MEEPDRLIEIPFEVQPHEHGTRLDVFLTRRMKRMSRSLANRLIQGRRIRRIPEGPLKASARVFEGQTVILKRRPLAEGPTDQIEIPVVFEDAHLLAVSKPGDLIVHPTATAYHRTAIRILRSRLELPDLDLAHRIDKETSGLLLLAKDFDSASSLKKQFARRAVEKAYLAVVFGVPRDAEFAIDVPLRLAESVTNVVMEVGGADDPPAITECRVLARGPRAALVEARPKTGRQHQIRVHLLAAGHPLVGDKLYVGGEEFFMEALRGDFPEEEIRRQVGHTRQALHAWRMTVEHPATRAPLTLTAPLAPDLWQVLLREEIPPPPELGAPRALPGRGRPKEVPAPVIPIVGRWRRPAGGEEHEAVPRARSESEP